MENLWLYEIWGETWGVVFADSEEEAEIKVREAYKKHDTGYDDNLHIFIKDPKQENHWFPDAPDVVEVFENC